MKKNRPGKASARSTQIYANLMHYFVLTCLSLLLIFFLAYITGFLPGQISPKEISRSWHLRAAAFTRETGIPPGWEGLSDITKGDVLCFAGLVFLTNCSAFCLFIIVFRFIKEKDFFYLIMAILQIIVLILTATGVFIP